MSYRNIVVSLLCTTTDISIYIILRSSITYKITFPIISTIIFTCSRIIVSCSPFLQISLSICNVISSCQVTIIGLLHVVTPFPLVSIQQFRILCPSLPAHVSIQVYLRFLSFFTSFRSNQHNTIGSLHTINSGGTILQNRYILNIVNIQGIERCLIFHDTIDNIKRSTHVTNLKVSRGSRLTRFLTCSNT